MKMKKTYYLNKDVLPTIPVPHDCIIKKIRIEHKWLIFTFDNDTSYYDSVRKLSPNIRNLILKPLFSLPSTPTKKSSAAPIPASRANCTFPGFSTFKFLTRIMDAITSTAMMIQVTTTDSLIPPRTGSVNTVSQFSSSIRLSARFPVLLPPFLPNVYCCILSLFVYSMANITAYNRIKTSCSPKS